MFTFRAQATACSKHHTRTVMDANPCDSWALVFVIILEWETEVTVLVWRFICSYRSILH